MASPAIQAQQVLVAEGAVYFWEPGAPDWEPIEPKATLIAGDAVYTAAGATAEILIGPRDFVRLTSHTQLILSAWDSGLMQFRVASGIVSFDLRSLPSGKIVEIDTPNASFIVGGTGYYRVDVQQNQTRFMPRRGGRATLTLADGRSRSIVANEEIVVEGSDRAIVQNRVIVEVDTWDRWNDARTDYYATSGLGVVWIDTGRHPPRERHRRPSPGWEHHEHPAPPGSWARPVFPPVRPPVVPPQRPVTPPDTDRHFPHRDPHDPRNGDHGHRDQRPDHRPDQRPDHRADPPTSPDIIGRVPRPDPSRPAPQPHPTVEIPAPRPVIALPAPKPAPPAPGHTQPIVAPPAPAPRLAPPIERPAPMPDRFPGRPHVDREMPQNRR